MKDYKLKQRNLRQKNGADFEHADWLQKHEKATRKSISSVLKIWDYLTCVFITTHRLFFRKKGRCGHKAIYTVETCCRL
jgi:hypothetical protein